MQINYIRNKGKGRSVLSGNGGAIQHWQESSIKDNKYKDRVRATSLSQSSTEQTLLAKCLVSERQGHTLRRLVRLMVASLMRILAQDLPSALLFLASSSSLMGTLVAAAGCWRL